MQYLIKFTLFKSILKKAIYFVIFTIGISAIFWFLTNAGNIVFVIDGKRSSSPTEEFLLSITLTW